MSTNTLIDYVQHKEFKLVPELVLCLLLCIEAKVTNDSDWTICEARGSTVCNCTNEVPHSIEARCRFNHVTELNVIIDTPCDIVRL